MNDPLIRQSTQGLTHRVAVNAKARGKNGLGRQLFTLAVQALDNVAAQGCGDGFPDRGTAGHVMKTSH
jgi:hypothetical protein